MAPSPVWHPNTQMSEWPGFDRIVRGRGMWLVDSNGRRMLDGVASMWCNVWGHSDREMTRAISGQASRLQHSPMFNLTHGPAEELAGRLVEISPGMHRVFFSDNGSSAMEVAFKMALQYWRNEGEPKRNRIASLENGYHGDTFGAMSVGYMPGFFGAFRSQLFKAARLPAPDARGLPEGADPERLGDECLGRIEEALSGDARIAAFVMESGAQMAGGAVIYPRRFQSGVRRICRRHGVLLVLDEVATGFGRLGPMVQYTKQGGSPDIVAYGKMLTGGCLTMAATLASKKIYESFLGEFDEGVHLFHGHTYTGNPIAAAAAVRNLELYESRGLIRRIAKTSKVLAGYAGEIAGMNAVTGVRHRGMLMGIDLDPGLFKAAGLRGTSPNRAVFERGRNNGVYLRTLGSTVMLVPPLAISGRELSMLARRTIRTIRDVEAAS